MHYDLNGNIRSFERYNGDEILKYKYLLDGNQLVRVKRYPGTKDSEGKVAFGIEEADNPFEYDTMGNLVYDGQNQLKISYDFLNLPEKIAPAELHSQAGDLFLANYCYLWNGEKVASTDVRGNSEASVMNWRGQSPHSRALPLPWDALADWVKNTIPAIS